MRCDENKELVWALAAGELATPAMSLRRQAVEGHLASCGACTSTFAELRAMREAVQSYFLDASGEASAAELSRLSSRLLPYIEAARPAPRARPLTWVLLGGSLAATLAVMWVSWIPQAPQEVAAPAQVTSVAPLRAWEPAPFVRVVATGESLVRERVVDERVSLVMIAGEAAFSFRGAEGRALSVTTAFGTVEVLGTRFSVALRDDGMRVQVAEGEVRVVGTMGMHGVPAGGAVWVTESAVQDVAMEPSRVLSDASLIEHHAHVEVIAPIEEVAVPASPKVTKKAEVEAPKLDATAILAELDEAERLAKAGQANEALAMYRAIATRSAPGLESYRDLARFEMARLYGFVLGDKERARAAFRLLTERGHEEVHAQAALSLCELERAVPCEAATCLTELAEGERRELAKEATRLLRAWGLTSVECP